jgi:hypothetical protein
LEALGIDVVLDAPGVGHNLHDRYEVAVVNELTRDYPVFAGSSLDVPADDARADALFTEWRDDRDGPYTTNGSLAAVSAKSTVAEDDPDLIVFALPIDVHGYYPGYSRDAVEHKNRLSVLVLKGHTNNRATSDPWSPVNSFQATRYAAASSLPSSSAPRHGASMPAARPKSGLPTIRAPCSTATSGSAEWTGSESSMPVYSPIFPDFSSRRLST